MRDPNQITIIGAGAVGLCAARALAMRGSRVTVLDQGEPGSGASRGNAGWVVPNRTAPVPAPGLVGASIRSLWQRDNAFSVRMAADSDYLRWLISFWRHCNARDHSAGTEATGALNARTEVLFDQLQTGGVPFEMERADILYAYRSPAALEHDLAGMDEPARPASSAHLPLDADALRAREPALNDDIVGGYAMPDQRWVRPETLVAGLVNDLTTRGVEIRSNVAVTGFDSQRGTVRAVHTSDGPFASENVLLCAGVWTAELGKLVGVRLPIQAGKGYSLDYTNPPRSITNALYLDEARLAVTPFDGTVRIAGLMELTPPDTALRPERLAAIAGGANRYLRDWPADPALASGWTGMRPLTPDGLPLIGRVPGFQNLLVAAGHAMLGITLAPATAEALAEMMGDERVPEMLKPFDPGRFSG